MNYCHIPHCPRTGSTYLNSYIAEYDNCIDLNEFLSMIPHLLPRDKNNNFIWVLKDNNLYDLIKDGNIDLYNKLVSLYWKDGWFYRRAILTSGKIKYCKIEKFTPLPFDIEKRLLTDLFEILKTTTDKYILKIFPGDVLKVNNKLNKDLIKELDNTKIITTYRNNILDLCISMAYAYSSKIYNNYDNSEIKLKRFNASMESIDIIFRELKNFDKLKLPDNTINFNYDKMFNKDYIINKLNIKISKTNKKFPVKLYPNMSSKERLSYINNKEDFENKFRKELRSLYND